MFRLSTTVALLLSLACSPGGGTVRRDGGPSQDASFDGGPGFDGGPRADIGPVRDSGPVPCSSAPGNDSDMDGFLFEDDCNDCSAQINAGAFDTPGNGIDEDCSGADATLAETECDGALPLRGSSADDAARAMGLCRFSPGGESWGVVSARFVRANGSGSPDVGGQVGLIPSLGAAGAQSGASMLALSSGIARAPNQEGYTSECDYFGLTPQSGGDEPYPPGFPVPSPACPGMRAGPVYNSVALELHIRVPTNALGFRFSSNFYTYEYPIYICDEYNDFFAVLAQEDGAPFANIVFDADGNAVSVNNSLLQACTPGTYGGKTFTCPLGRGLLSGTGFDGSAFCGSEDEFGFPYREDIGAATGWLRTTSAVTGGSLLTLRFAVWDSGDPDLDSLTLIDSFEWEVEDVVDEQPITEPLI